MLPAASEYPIRIREGRWPAGPLLAVVLRSRAWCGVILAVAAGQLISVHAHWGSLGCPVRNLTGVPCPGCGLTAATMDLLRGDWRAGCARHVFAPLFLLALGTILLAVILPEKLHAALVRRVAAVETRTGAAAWFLVTLTAYWAVRQCLG